MFRQYDIECRECKWQHTGLIWVDAGKDVPKRVTEECPHCGHHTRHNRLISCPAEYMGEKDQSPAVGGGRFDTMGKEALPKLPTLPSGSHSDQYRELFSKPEYREVQAERREVKRRNAQKRKRLAAKKRGENINFKRDRCDGDPKFAA